VVLFFGLFFKPARTWGQDQLLMEKVCGEGCFSDKNVNFVKTNGFFLGVGD
jgi:hypothetical protein